MPPPNRDTGRVSCISTLCAIPAAAIKSRVRLKSQVPGPRTERETENEHSGCRIKFADLAANPRIHQFRQAPEIGPLGFPVESADPGPTHTHTHTRAYTDTRTHTHTMRAEDG